MQWHICFQNPAKIAKNKVSKCETGKRKKYYFHAQTFDYFMTLEELFAHSQLRFLICNCICNRLISLSHELFIKMANKNNYIKNSNILTVELSSDNEYGSQEYNC